METKEPIEPERSYLGWSDFFGLSLKHNRRPLLLNGAVIALIMGLLWLDSEGVGSGELFMAAMALLALTTMLNLILAFAARNSRAVYLAAVVLDGCVVMFLLQVFAASAHKIGG